MRIPFTKMHGAGNDFVVVDHRQSFLPTERRRMFARWCDRRRGIGADGVLLLERDSEHHFAMRYHNADGGAADFCGNGARCLARFALDLGLGEAGEVRFRSDVGVMRARSLPDGPIALAFGRVTGGDVTTLATGGRSFTGRRVVAGVPHLVLPVPDVSAVPMASWAPDLRSHVALGPEGANVDFVTRLPDGRVAMRTWERGVEGETLACGSGAMATALWAVLEGAEPPVTVRTTGGEDLLVELTPGPGDREATLVGPAVKVFTGEWQEP